MKPGSKQWKLFMSKLYGFGAAIVIIGAMFKIMHWPGAGPMLVVGLTTEAVIFIFSAFEPIHEDPDWTLVYPELALGHGDDHGHHAIAGSHDDANESITEQLDNMLAEAKIDSELIDSLSKGLKSLSDNANKLGEVTGASSATEEYVSSLKNASDRVGKLSGAYEEASTALMGLASTQKEGASFGEQMQKVSTNLASLNNVYEMQLKGSSEHLQATQQLYSGISELMTNLHDSLEDTRKYKESMAELSKNLTALNTVYGNMLSAMNFNRG
ncbi:MAG: gliding motility protein GldL [Flavobacteriales bacterium]